MSQAHSEGLDGRPIVRLASPRDDDVLISHYAALWQSYGVPDDWIRKDAAEVVREFIREGREEQGMAAFLAVAGDIIVGSVACQLHRLPYPDVVVPRFRRFGYIWHVFVVPEARRRGIARMLVEHAVDHLRSLECTHAVLHSSEAGEALYRGLGFSAAREMRLELTE